MTKDEAFKSAAWWAQREQEQYVAIKCKNGQWMRERLGGILSSNSYTTKEKKTAIVFSPGDAVGVPLTQTS